MIEHENMIRLSAFVGCLILLILWQKISPRRPHRVTLWKRRFNNLALIMTGTLIIRFTMPLITVSYIAHLAQQHNFGLFNFLEINSTITVLLSLLILDCAIYWQHRIFHSVPVLWQLHKVHHSDKDMDTTTGIRFHPLELMLSIVIKSLLVYMFGMPLLAVIVFELILNILPLFNHSNIYIKPSYDQFLRYFIVTPDMHRIHHSTIKHETNSNYGFSISLWDKIFHSYTQEPIGGQHNMEIGLDDIPETETINLLDLLIQPFKTKN